MRVRPGIVVAGVALLSALAFCGASAWSAYRSSIGELYLVSMDDLWQLHSRARHGGTFRIVTAPYEVPRGLERALQDVGDLSAPVTWEAPLTEAEVAEVSKHIELELRERRQECRKALPQGALVSAAVYPLLRLELDIARLHAQRDMLLQGHAWVMRQPDWNRLDDGILQFGARAVYERIVVTERFTVRDREQLKVILWLDGLENPRLFARVDHPEIKDAAVTQAVRTFNARPRDARVAACQRYLKLDSEFRENEGLDRMAIWREMETITPPGTRLDTDTFELHRR